MNTITRDDTEHGQQYVGLGEVHQAIGQMQALMRRAVERLEQHMESLASSYRVGGVVKDREVAAALPWGQRQVQEPAKACGWTPEDDLNMPGTWRSDCGVMSDRVMKKVGACDQSEFKVNMKGNT